MKARPFVRHEKKRETPADRLIAYDFETTRIDKGTPRPLYLTAYSENPIFRLEERIDCMAHLLDLLRDRFLRDDLAGVRYVAWNANNFDAYFIAAALINDSAYVIRPFMTKSHTLRGLCISLTDELALPEKKQKKWYFLDGIAMLGLSGFPLAKFLKTFAPNYCKLEGVIDFSNEEFNPDRADHRDYAMRDSVGLWHGMQKAQSILLRHFEENLSVTMGAAGIKIFRANIPKGVSVYPPNPALSDIIRSFLLRGGFCYCARRYHGPVWKYDLNQAYAAGMRETDLPAGRAMVTKGGIHKYAQIFIARVTARKTDNPIPFYYRTEQFGRIRALFAETEIQDTWITCDEYWQLEAEGWALEVIESISWESLFRMTDFVNNLETLRMTCEGGPSGAIGTMVKAVGNHSYGKTSEVLGNETFLISGDQPPGYEPFYGDGMSPFDHVWMAFEEAKIKDYHQPQLASFITASVRMKVRRAALLNPSAWLYADTDCVIYSEDMTAALDIHPSRYGAWKIEEEGTVYRIIAKKVYQDTASKKGTAKGLHVRELTDEDFERWFEGEEPEQEQTQRQNFLSVMQGAEMFKKQIRRGTSIEKNNSIQQKISV